MKDTPMRDGYGKALLELSRLHEDVMVLDADVAKSTRSEWVKQENPSYFLDCGISEQDMVGTAAGMALAGLTPLYQPTACSLRAAPGIRSATPSAITT